MGVLTHLAGKLQRLIIKWQRPWGKRAGATQTNVTLVYTSSFSLTLYVMQIRQWKRNCNNTELLTWRGRIRSQGTKNGADKIEESWWKETTRVLDVEVNGWCVLLIQDRKKGPESIFLRKWKEVISWKETDNSVTLNRKKDWFYFFILRLFCLCSAPRDNFSTSHLIIYSC